MGTVNQNIISFLQSCQSVFETDHATEHSYRKSLEILLSSLDSALTVLNEPKRQKVGAPDFILFRNEVQIGFVEAKDMFESLNDKKFNNQITRYQALGNLCFTNNLDWKFYKGTELIGEISIAKIENNVIVPIESNFDLLSSYLKAFIDNKTITIKSSKQLAIVMAKKAKTMRDILIKILETDYHENNKSEIVNEYEAFKKILIHDLTIEKFADIYSQTITYGLFTARFYDKTIDTFTRLEAASNLPKSNPFLRKLFGTIAGIDLDDRLAWVVDNLVDAFAHTDVHSIMSNFGESTKMSDPVLHFYETFLAEYDPKTRKATGVYYTPDPVVKFIVRSVDEILKTDFNLPMGLADNSKITREVDLEQAKNRKDVRVETKANNHKKFFEDFHKVQILDPATGTGTFLLEVIKTIYSKFEHNKGIWNTYAQNDLIPRIHGFELLMASYSMAHLKLSMFLAETGVEISDRLSVYLTNSLEEPETAGFDLFSQWLSHESEEASRIKNKAPVMVVIGNPPYAVSSSNNSEWIQGLMQDYKKDLNEKNIQPLSDDYIKFIRYGHHFIQKNGEGVMAYISNNSFLDGVIHRQMRKEILKNFDKVYIIDLHGNSKKKEIASDGSKDVNVFDIQQGVSINIFVKTAQKSENQDATVYHYDLYGDRKYKYEILEQNSLQTLDLKTLEPDEKYKFFVPKDFRESLEYEKGVKLSELFGIYGSGVKSRKDNLLIQFNNSETVEMLEDMIGLDKVSIQLKYKLHETDDWKIDQQRVNFANYRQEDILKYNYRPFDIRAIYYPFNKINQIILRGDSRHNLMNNYIHRNLGLISTRQLSSNYFHHVFITDKLSDMCYISNGGKESGYNFPLYLYPEAKNNSSVLIDNAKPKPNFNPELIKQIESELKMNLDWEVGIEESYLDIKGVIFTPVDLLYYIYAVLYSPSYREKYKEFLKIDFPRVPFSSFREVFWQLVEIGSKLRDLHLLEEINLTDLKVRYPESGDNKVEKVIFDSGKVWINNSQFFVNVSDIAWNFYIGGYQPAQKWLKDRKGRELSYDDIIHYQKVLYVLTETDRLMNDLDKLIS
jgi:predicted helicase